MATAADKNELDLDTLKRMIEWYKERIGEAPTKFTGTQEMWNDICRLVGNLEIVPIDLGFKKDPPTIYNIRFEIVSEEELENLTQLEE